MAAARNENNRQFQFLKGRSSLNNDATANPKTVPESSLHSTHDKQMINMIKTLWKYIPFFSIIKAYTRKRALYEELAILGEFVTPLGEFEIGWNFGNKLRTIFTNIPFWFWKNPLGMRTFFLLSKLTLNFGRVLRIRNIEKNIFFKIRYLAKVPENKFQS